MIKTLISKVLELYAIGFIVFLLILCVGYLFTKTSKKQNREWWAQQRPDEALPEKYKYDPNDPDDDKPKMSGPSGFIIAILILAFIVAMIWAL
jgi:hypothetical protein